MAVQLALLAFSLVLSVARVAVPAAELPFHGVQTSASDSSSRAVAALAGSTSTAAHVFWNGAVWIVGLGLLGALAQGEARQASRARASSGYARGGRAELASERGL